MPDDRQKPKPMLNFSLPAAAFAVEEGTDNHTLLIAKENEDERLGIP